MVYSRWECKSGVIGITHLGRMIHLDWARRFSGRWEWYKRGRWEGGAGKGQGEHR